MPPSAIKFNDLKSLVIFANLIIPNTRRFVLLLSLGKIGENKMLLIPNRFARNNSRRLCADAVISLGQ